MPPSEEPGAGSNPSASKKSGPRKSAPAVDIGASTGAKPAPQRPSGSTPSRPSPLSRGDVEPHGTIAEGLSEREQPILEDLQGRQVGEYQLLRRLGKGGMAEVYLAEQTSLRRNVAVKILRGSLVDADDVLIKRFAQEAKAAGALNHPNIIQVYAIGEDSGLHFIAQEYVKGMNLREFIAKRGVPDLPIALHIIRQVASALEAAADAGIVHRDIKPENIMISSKGKVKVADFGLAQLTQAGERVNLTQVGMTMGTPLYMSPEQINGSNVDQRSDIYSLGVTCYHILTGQPPFRGATAMSIAVKHLKEEPARLQERRPDLPNIMCQIVHKMMAKDPAQRYQSAQAVSADLKKLAKVVKEQPDAAAEMSLSAMTLAAPSEAIRKVSWFVRHPLASFILSCLLASSASAAFGWWMRPASPLATPPAPSRVPKQASAEQQFLKAKFVDDEAHWQAVLEYFPNDKVWDQRAKAQLGLIALRNRNRWPEAEQIFSELSTFGEDNALKAAGYTGKAALESLRGDHKKSQQTLAFNVEPLRSSIDSDPQLRRLVLETLNKNRKMLDAQANKEYENLFREE